MYFAIGQPNAGLIPLIATVAILISLHYFNKTKNFNIPVNSFIGIMLILPPLIQIFNGGFINSGAVIAWSAMVPIVSLAFKPKASVKFSFLLFFLVVFLTLIIELIGLPDYNQLNAHLIEGQFAVNIVGVVATAFFPLLGFSKELESTRKNLKIRNQTIDNSYEYAKYIQYSIIPSESQLKSIFDLNLFVISMPKHGVGGDFYWSHTIDHKSFIICADCTGHGVPGAFMTLTAINHLNSTVRENNIEDPSLILESLHKKLQVAFAKSATKYNDSINMTVCVIDRDRSIIDYASTKSQVYFFDGIYVVKYRTDKHKIGTTYSNVQFNIRTIKFKKGNILYLTTDDITNQFVQETDKKLKTKKLLAELNKYAPYPIELQKGLFKKSIKKWRGELDQTEDILMLGLVL